MSVLCVHHILRLTPVTLNSQCTAREAANLHQGPHRFHSRRGWRVESSVSSAGSPRATRHLFPRHTAVGALHSPSHRWVQQFAISFVSMSETWVRNWGFTIDMSFSIKDDRQSRDYTFWIVVFDPENTWKNYADLFCRLLIYRLL